MQNPFEDPEGRFLVLRNDENQHSLWPAALPVPAGWKIELAQSSRQESLDYVEKVWTDLRPASVSRE